MHGWAGKRLRVYLTEGRIVEEETPERLRQEYIGGRGFNSKTLFDEVKPGIDPLGPDNLFMLSVGPLGGTLAPCGARWTVTAKAPLTGIFGEGSGGGHLAPELKFAGYDQIIFHGRSPKPVYLWINDGRAILKDAAHLWGKTTGEAFDLLAKELKDPEIRELIIGPAGENQVRLAKVFNNKSRAAGKCGLGAVMGSKNLKAIVVRGTGSVKIAHPAEFYKAARHAFQKISTSPFGQILKEQGTLYLLKLAYDNKSISTRNSQAGLFEGCENVTSEVFEARYAVRNTGCFGCIPSCSHVFRVKEGPYASYGNAAEYGTLYPFTSKLGISNMAAALKLKVMCDQLGLDTHSTGSTIAFAMEAWQRGFISKKDTDGLDLGWGNIDSVIKLVDMIAYRKGFGYLLADGSKLASRQIKGSEVCLAETKGLECSSYFPGPGERKATALAFATAPIGGSLHFGRGLGSLKIKKILKEKTGTDIIDHSDYKGQGLVVATDNNFNALLNSIETCTYACGAERGLINEDDLAWLLSSATGFEIDGEGLMKAGERIFNTEKAFNLREGLRRKDDTLSDRFFFKKVDAGGNSGLDRSMFEEMLDEYYESKGWDREGFPTEETLRRLNLDDVAHQLEKIRTAP